jgi:parallel beta-helix repeat protein
LENLTEENGDVGFLLVDTTNNTLASNRALRNGDSANPSGAGFKLVGASNNTFVDNIVKANGSSGFGLEHSNNNTFEDSDVRGHTESGFFISYSSGNALIANEIVRNGYGIWLFGANSNRLVDNDVLHTAGEGVLFYEAASGNVLERNRSVGGLIGFVLTGEHHEFGAKNNVLIGNVAAENRQEGFLLAGGGVEGNTLTRNEATQNLVGFSVWENSIGNTFTRNVGSENANWDAEEFNAPGANVWQKNKFSTTFGL